MTAEQAVLLFIVLYCATTVVIDLWRRRDPDYDPYGWWGKG